MTGPEPLRQQNARSAALLRELDASYRRGLDERAAWRRLQRRQRRPPLRFAAKATALGLAAGVLLWLLLGALRTQPFAPAADAGLAEPELLPRSRLRPALSALPPVTAARPERAPESRPLVPAHRAPPPGASAGELPAPPPSADAPRVDCLKLARDGQPAQAEQCFVQQSLGSGLGAQMALYELARLRKDVLRDERGALRALSDYRERFPAGSLRTEVEVSYVELLVRAGRFDEALAQSERLLASPDGQERKGQLHLLRGNVYRSGLGDCDRAEPEYRAVADQPGTRGDQAQFWRAWCLEQLGRRDEAIAAYRVYLARESPQRAEQAGRRLQELAPAEPGVGP